jgi:hypothetical protein
MQPFVPKPKLSLFMLIFCWIVRCDPTILAESTLLDKMVVAGEALLLLLVASASGVAWTCFWAQFLSMWAAVCFGLFASFFILLIDQAIGCADWRLTGILQNPANKAVWANVAKLSVRIALSVVLSFATAIGATMAICHDAIKAQLEETRREINQKIDDRYGWLIQDLITRTYGPRITDVKAAKENITQITAQLDGALRRKTDAESAKKIAIEEAGRELRGDPGYRRGCRTLCRKDLALIQVADTAIAKASTDITTIFEPRLTEANNQLAEASKSLRVAEASAQGKVADIEAEKRSKWVPERQDALMSWMALDTLSRSPTLGAATRHFTFVITSVLLAVELSYVMVRVLFAHASIYMVLLIKATKLRSEREAMDYEVSSAGIKQARDREIGPRPPLPPLRIISG